MALYYDLPVFEDVYTLVQKVFLYTQEYFGKLVVTIPSQPSTLAGLSGKHTTQTCQRAYLSFHTTSCISSLIQKGLHRIDSISRKVIRPVPNSGSNLSGVLVVCKLFTIFKLYQRIIMKQGKILALLLSKNHYRLFCFS